MDQHDTDGLRSSALTRDIAHRRTDKQQQTTHEQGDGSHHRKKQQKGCYRAVPIRREVVRLEVIGVRERVQCAPVDGLTRSIGEKETFPT